jgi:hypothetical protein
MPQHRSNRLWASPALDYRRAESDARDAGGQGDPVPALADAGSPQLSADGPRRIATDSLTRIARWDRILQGTAHGSTGCLMRRHPRRGGMAQVGARTAPRSPGSQGRVLEQAERPHGIPGAGRSACPGAIRRDRDSPENRGPDDSAQVSGASH